jgi:hypothetical protein
MITLARCRLRLRRADPWLVVLALAGHVGLRRRARTRTPRPSITSLGSAPSAASLGGALAWIPRSLTRELRMVGSCPRLRRSTTRIKAADGLAEHALENADNDRLGDQHNAGLDGEDPMSGVVHRAPQHSYASCHRTLFTGVFDGESESRHNCTPSSGCLGEAFVTSSDTARLAVLAATRYRCARVFSAGRRSPCWSMPLSMAPRRSLAIFRYGLSSSPRSDGCRPPRRGYQPAG